MKKTRVVRHWRMISCFCAVIATIVVTTVLKKYVPYYSLVAWVTGMYVGIVVFFLTEIFLIPRALKRAGVKKIEKNKYLYSGNTRTDILIRKEGKNSVMKDFVNDRKKQQIPIPKKDHPKEVFENLLYS